MNAKEMEQEIEKRVAERVEQELTPVDTEEMYNEMLDDCYSFESVGGPFTCMEPHRVLEEVDPIAYRCGKNDYEDSLRDEYEDINENFYDKKEVQDIRDEVEAEVEEEQAEEDKCEGETERMGKVVKA